LEQEKTLASLRKMILDGTLPKGQKIAEQPISELLGVSRTPVRVAFKRLVDEGMLELSNTRRYIVRGIDREQIRGVLEVRGVLEGLAAKRLAQYGASDEVKKILSDSIAASQGLLRSRTFSEKEYAQHERFNTIFHRTIVEKCGNSHILQTCDRMAHLPLAALGTVIYDRENMEREHDRLMLGVMQHQIIFKAIVDGDPLRAEAVAREHSHATLDYEVSFVDLYEDPAEKAEQLRKQ